MPFAKPSRTQERRPHVKGVRKLYAKDRLTQKWGQAARINMLDRIASGPLAQLPPNSSHRTAKHATGVLSRELLASPSTPRRRCSAPRPPASGFLVARPRPAHSMPPAPRRTRRAAP